MQTTVIRPKMSNPLDKINEIFDELINKTNVLVDQADQLIRETTNFIQSFENISTEQAGQVEMF